MNMSRCDENANCANTDGSYNCSCNHGYMGDGFNCNGNLFFPSCTAAKFLKETSSTTKSWSTKSN